MRPFPDEPPRNGIEHKPLGGCGLLNRIGISKTRSMQEHLLIFASSLIFPVLIFAVILTWYYITTEQRRADEQAHSAAQQLMLGVDRELATPILMLQALATSPFLQSRDLQSFHARASQIARGVGFTIVLRAPNTPLELVNTSVPFGTPLKGGNGEVTVFEAEAARTKAPVISDLVRGPAQGIWVAVVIGWIRRSYGSRHIEMATPTRR